MKKYIITSVVLALAFAGTASAALHATRGSHARIPAPRVGVSGTIGPVCGRHHGDGTLRFIRLGQHCKKGETFFYLHVRFKANPKSLRGAQGFPGPQGAQGIQGIAGVAGVKGDTGVAGAQGEVGPAGAMGPIGPAGPMGATGAQGEQGLQGEIGATGPAGMPGLDGAVGPMGPTGEAGPAGAQGEPGPAGATGPAGEAGAKGDTGATGAQGQQGIQGPKGDKGDTGAQGPQGIPGPKGDTGAAGLDGSAIVTVSGGTASGDKQFTVSCPAGDFALSGGFDIQGSVTASYRSNAAGDPTGTNAWTIKQSSGASLSGKVYVYCVAGS